MEKEQSQKTMLEKLNTYLGKRETMTLLHTIHKN